MGTQQKLDLRDQGALVIITQSENLSETAYVRRCAIIGKMSRPVKPVKRSQDSGAPDPVIV